MESELPLHNSRLSADQAIWYTRLTWPRSVARNLKCKRIIVPYGNNKTLISLRISTVWSAQYSMISIFFYASAQHSLISTVVIPYLSYIIPIVAISKIWKILAKGVQQPLLWHHVNRAICRPISYCSYIWAPSSGFVSSSIPSWQILTAHAQPFRRARDLAFCLKVPLDSLLVWASSADAQARLNLRCSHRR